MKEKINHFLRIIGEYYLGIESFKQSRKNQSFLAEFYPDSFEAEIEKQCADRAILTSTAPPFMLQIGGLAGSIADMDPYYSIGFILFGELWRTGFCLYRKSIMAYAEKIKSSLIEFEQLGQEGVSRNSCRYREALQRLEKLI